MSTSESLPAHAPLTGVRVLVPRARAQARQLCDALEHAGAETVVVPTLEFGPPEDAKPLDNALAGLDDYAWVAFTSANGVDYTLARLTETNGGTERLTRLHVAAIGPATVEALERHGVHADLVPPRGTDDALCQVLIGHLQPGERLLLPRAELADDALPDALRAAGVWVETVVAYRSFPPEDLKERMTAAFTGAIDAITFTSPSTITNLLAALGSDERERLRNVVIACIGPSTARAANDAGLTVAVEAVEQTAQGLAAALAAWWEEGEGRRLATTT